MLDETPSKMHEEVDGEKSVIFTYYFGYQFWAILVRAASST